jgi:hypothetical protein
MVSDARGDAVVGSEVEGGGESMGLRGVLWWKEDEEEDEEKWVKSKGREADGVVFWKRSAQPAGLPGFLTEPAHHAALD